MKIAVIGPTYPYKGGISHFTTLLVKNLRQTHEVNFFSWKRQYPNFLYPVEPLDNNSKFKIEEDSERALDFLNPLTWVSTFFKIKQIQVDKLILTWVTPVQAPVYMIIAFLVKKLTRTKITFLCHNVLPHESHFYDKPLMKLVFRYGDNFIVHSTEDKENLNKIISNKQVILGFHPIYDIFKTEKKYSNEAIRAELGLKKKVVLFFGYIRPYKGLKYLLEALPGIVKTLPDLSLLIVGEFWGKNKQEYFGLVEKLKIKNKVIFIDRYVPNEEVGKYFSVADVLVLPYTSATQSGIIQIAYAFDKPVICTAVGGLKEVLEDGKSGYFIKPHDNKDIEKKVLHFFAKGIKSEQIASLKEKYSWTSYTTLIMS